MKKVFYFLWGLLLALIIIDNCYAKKTLEFNDPVIEFDRPKNYKLQGFTTTDEYLFTVLVGYEDTSSIIKVYDLNTYEEIKSIEYTSLGHANDVTYNKNSNKIFVLASSGSNEVFVFDGDSFEYVGVFSIEVPARSITYIEDQDMYAVRTVSVGYLLNKQFSLISKVPFIFGMNFNIDMGRQGWSYYNGFIYYTNWSWVRYGGDGNNIIYIYDLDGKKQDVLYTNNDIGEIEDIAFVKDKMILGFNGYDGKIKFYSLDVPEVEVIKETVTEEVVEEEDNSFILWIILGIGISVTIIVVYLIIRKKKMST